MLRAELPVQSNSTLKIRSVMRKFWHESGAHPQRRMSSSRNLRSLGCAVTHFHLRSCTPVPKSNDGRMELILWRHADADENEEDLSRKLSPRGHRQVAWIAGWLQQRLPTRFAVFTSPAERAKETAAALGVETKVCERLGPGAGVADVLDLIDWPKRTGSVAVVVGHQPTLGRIAAYLMTGVETELSIRKGGLWWIARRDREGKPNVVVRAVISPDIL